MYILQVLIADTHIQALL